MGLFDDDTCDGCVYADPVLDDLEREPFLLCRRYPPVVVSDLSGEVITQTFPTATMRCGEYTDSPSV